MKMLISILVNSRRLSSILEKYETLARRLRSLVRKV